MGIYMYEAVVREGVSGEGGYYLGMCHAVDDRVGQWVYICMRQ